MTVLNIENLNSMYRNIWWNSSTEFSPNMPITSISKKKINEKHFDNLIDKILEDLKSFPKDTSDRLFWKDKISTSLENLITTQNMFDLNTLDEGLKNKFFKSTKDFLSESKLFDIDISYEDIGQALRNVWIINMFQLAINEDIKFTPGIFGYSMLYPYTDNYLDDVSISIDDKKTFNNRFTKRLDGDKVSFINNHEEKVYKLVEYIETQYDRLKYPKVYDALLQIHEAQKKSLSQQEIVSIPYEKDILSISIEKGGSSVLADGYLIRGTLTKDEELFAYGYGFLLQLCYDLQDIKSDLENNHMTIMSQLSVLCPLDLIVNKLINLTIYVIDNAKCFTCSNEKELRRLIKNNCINMILFAVVNNKDYFSKDYIKEVVELLPFTLKYIDKMKKNLKKKFKRLKSDCPELSLEEIAFYLPD
ncbi:MAG: hypothetical protein RR636_06475 [Clostridium sp.]|uniref:hypothetical protein n=1 Tax=Clostridium sp. TaxID=1506 RepID=UPI00307443B6